MLSKSIKITSILAAALIVAACAANPQGPTASDNVQTVANAQLRADVMRSIGTYESALGGSRNPSLISAEPVSKNGTSHVERWVVDSNGKKAVYRVTLVPSPKGGVDFGVAKLPE